METSPAASPILRDYYRVGVGTTVTDAQMQSAAFQSAHPWSAVFVSYVMRIAGAGPAFAYSTLHQTYIRAARQNRLSRNSAHPFWAFRATEVAPRVGDLVCASREPNGATYDNIADPQKWWKTHCDIVVEVRPGRIRVIGGNVSQTVGDTWLRTLSDGRPSLVGTQSPLFAAICCRPGSASPPALTPAPAPGTAGEDARVLRVMELLVNRYRYPVNGAAGLVGNLIAESSVLPNRIEGSHSATPMRAPDFTGRLQDFTADQVRDRSFGRRARVRHRPSDGRGQARTRRVPGTAWESLVALANADGGVLLLGVDENGGRIDVTGIDDPRATADNVQSVCAELEPALRPRVSLIAHDGGKTVVVAEVPPVPRDMRPAIVRQSALTKARSSASATPTSR